LQRHLLAEEPEPTGQETRSVALPAGTIDAVRALVGDENAPAFIAAAAERELRARELDVLAATHRQSGQIDQIG
ncbi:MerR family transcriptional regulator, partial [Streptomyces niveus]